MAKTKQTIERFIKDYEGYIESIQSSISRVKQEQSLWQQEQKALDEAWAGAPVVANLVGTHSSKDWWAALNATDHPDLMAIRVKADEDIAELVQHQRFARDKIQECTLRNQDLDRKMQETTSVYSEAVHDKEVADSVLKAANATRESFFDQWTDVHAKKWARQPDAARSPMEYDYDQPQPWWAKPWLLAMTNSAMAENMKQAAYFKEKTGKSLYEAAQGYQQRLQAREEAKEQHSQASIRLGHVTQIRSALEHNKKQTTDELQRSLQWIAPETGPHSLHEQTVHIQSKAIDRAARFCIMNNVATVGALTLALPDAQEYAQRAGKYMAMQKVKDSLDTTVTQWRHGEKNVEAGLDAFKKLGRKHHRHTKVSVDSESVQNLTRNIEHASVTMHGRFKSARENFRNPTPFATTPPTATSFSNNSSNYSNSSTTSNDSTFWTMAWMYMLMSPSHASGFESGNSVFSDGQHSNLLDPQKFEQEFNKANDGSGVGLVYDPALDGPLDTSGIGAISVDTPSSDFFSGATSFSVDVPDVSIEVDKSSSGASWSSSDSGSSWSSSSSDSGSSWSSGSSCSSSSGSSCSSSSGSSCGSSD